MSTWITRADYEDGTSIEIEYNYTAKGNYEQERKEQHQIEKNVA